MVVVVLCVVSLGFVVVTVAVVVVVVVVVDTVEVAVTLGDVVAGTPNSQSKILSTRVCLLVVVSFGSWVVVMMSVGAAVVVSRGKRIPKNLSFSCSANGTQRVISSKKIKTRNLIISANIR